MLNKARRPLIEKIFCTEEKKKQTTENELKKKKKILRGTLSFYPWRVTIANWERGVDYWGC